MNYLSSVFGLLDAEISTDVPKLTLDFTNAPRLHFFKYVKIDNHVALKCSCKRQHEPYFIEQSLFDRIFPTQGIFACETCLNDKRNAKTIKDQIQLALVQNADSIEQGNHLILDFPSDKIYDPVKQQMVRVRRIIYELYYNITLESNQNVLTVCGNKQCLCPSHLLAARSPAVKVTPEMRADIHAWASRNLPNKTIRELIQHKYQKSVSLRTIINIKKLEPAQTNLQT